MKKVILIVISILMLLMAGCASMHHQPLDAAKANSEETAQAEHCSTSKEGFPSEDAKELCCSDPDYIYAKADYLAVGTWLRNKLDGSVVVLDARSEKEYQKKHIKGAIHVSWQQFTDMKNKKPGDAGFGVLLEEEALGQAIIKLGIDGTKPILVYGNAPEGWGEEGRIVWSLLAAGIKDVKLLSGGWKAWEKSGYETDSDVPTIEEAENLSISMDEALTATTSYINESMSSLKMIDARTPQEFEGAVLFGEKRGGHLPGSINIPWDSVVDKDGYLLHQKDLVSLFSSFGIKNEDDLVVYCTKGIRSAYLTMVLRLAGYEKAKNYDASFYEWAGKKELPLEQ